MSNGIHKPFRRLAGIAVLAAALSPIAVSTSVADKVEASPEIVGKRIAIAGRQRMLAESMAKSVCYAQSGIDNEASLRDLYITWNIYGWYHQGIYSGNVQLELFPESNRRVIRSWQTVDGVWVTMSDLNQAAWQGKKVSEGQFELMMGKTDEIAELSNRLVSELRARYGDRIAESGGQMSALLIDLYERQRMLGQKLSKEVCLIARDFNTDEVRASLDTTMSIFVNSLGAFQTGMPALSIPPAPTPEIQDRLATAQQHWDNIASVAEAARTGSAISREDLVRFREEMDLFLSDMTMAINLLVSHEASKS